jgi:hypothetical protein
MLLVSGLNKETSAIAVSDARIEMSRPVTFSNDIDMLARLQVPMITITNFATSSAAAAAVPSSTTSSASPPRYILNTDDISDYAVTAEKLAPLSVSTNRIQSNAVVPHHLVDLCVSSGKLASNAVTASKIASLAVQAIHLDGASVQTHALDTSCVTTDKLADGAVASSKLAVNAVNTENISDAAVVGDKLAESSVGTAKLVASAVTAEKLAPGSVRSVHLDSNLALQGSVFLASNAFVGLGECNYTTHALHVQGSVYAAGGYYSLSDPACKAHVSNVDGADALRRLHQVQGVTYELLKDAAQIPVCSHPVTQPTQTPYSIEHPRYVGFLAPAVLRAFPEAVHCKRRAVGGANCNDLPETDSQHHMSIAYGNLVAVLTEAVKYMDQRLATVECHLSRLSLLMYGDSINDTQ